MGTHVCPASAMLTLTPREWDPSVCPFIHPTSAASLKGLAENWAQRGTQERLGVLLSQLSL